jgi:hypothetical protein
MIQATTSISRMKTARAAAPTSSRDPLSRSRSFQRKTSGRAKLTPRRAARRSAAITEAGQPKLPPARPCGRRNCRRNSSGSKRLATVASAAANDPPNESTPLMLASSHDSSQSPSQTGTAASTVMTVAASVGRRSRLPRPATTPPSRTICLTNRRWRVSRRTTMPSPATTASGRAVAAATRSSSSCRPRPGWASQVSPPAACRRSAAVNRRALRTQSRWRGRRLPAPRSRPNQLAGQTRVRGSRPAPRPPGEQRQPGRGSVPPGRS